MPSRTFLFLAFFLLVLTSFSQAGGAGLTCYVYDNGVPIGSAVGDSYGVAHFTTWATVGTHDYTWTGYLSYVVPAGNYIDKTTVTVLPLDADTLQGSSLAQVLGLALAQTQDFTYGKSQIDAKDTEVECS